MTGEAGRRPGIPRGERGAITVADRVVAKIASQVAREALSRFTESAGHVPPGCRTPGVTTSVRRAPERNTAERRDAESAAGRQALLGEARLRITVELGHPSDIGAQCAAVRREVTERLRTWAGMEVTDLAVSIERPHSAHTRHTRHTGQERVR